MNKIAYLTVLLLFAAGIYIGCSDGVSHLDELVFDEVITLHVGESVYYVPDDLTIGFERTTHESRCPSNRDCLWTGMVRVQIWLVKSDQDTVIAAPAIIGGSGDSASVRYFSAVALGYRVSLLRLNPYPRDIGHPDPDEYVVTIQIEALNGDAYVPPVIITDLPPDSILLDPYWVDALSIDGDMLSVSIQYGGGCIQHSFQLYMTPAAFLESHPVQASLYLWHNSYDDPCKAIVPQTVTFDIRAIAALFQSQYRGGDGEIWLNVHEFDDDDYTQHESILYTF